MVRRLLLSLVAAFTLSSCAPSQSTQAIDRLTPCTGNDTPVDAYCGSLKVFENRATKQGRQIALNIVVLPALRADAQPDPLFFLAGGPGQGAAKMSKPIREIFRRVQTDRDIVLVDQRGTGKSNPLNCNSDDESLQAVMETPEQALGRLKACLAKYDADLTQYTTTIAMDDLDEVRAFLGYERINIYGGSYGTRAGLEYMRRHGDRVRAAVLDGVAPPDMGLPLHFARDSQRAFDMLVKDCESDPGCQKAYPNIGARTRALVERLEQQPPTVKLTHPRTAETADVRIDVRVLAGVIVSTLYSPMASALVPAIIAAAERDDFQAMLALASGSDTGAEPNMAIGMQLSVICPEDGARYQAEDLARESEGTLFGKHVMRLQTDACAFWPKAAIDPAYYQPLKSAIPTLVLSGEIDPVTPPVWGEQITQHLTAAKHIVVPGTGHGVVSTGCGQRIIREFIDKGSAASLDITCVGKMKRPPFFLTPSGPDPGQVAK